jgi:hypothetical protein
MKRYILFGGDDYYPGGGWSDVLARYESVEEAIGHFDRRQENKDWMHLIDVDTGAVLRRKGQYDDEDFSMNPPL